MSAVDAAYAEVQRVTRERAKNFAYGIMVLPREKRRAIAAIYAFAREVDDVADGGLPVAEKRVRLEALRASLDAEPAGAMAIALHDARARYAIPRDALSALVDGGLQDLEQTRYATFDDLRGYCEKVAGAVGVACIAVYGSEDVERAMAHLDEGLRLLDSLDRRSALCVATFAGLYRGQLDRMEANGFDVFGPSCRLSTAAKLAVVARGLVR